MLNQKESENGQESETPGLGLGEEISQGHLEGGCEFKRLILVVMIHHCKQITSGYFKLILLVAEL